MSEYDVLILLFRADDPIMQESQYSDWNASLSDRVAGNDASVAIASQLRSGLCDMAGQVLYLCALNPS